MTSLQPQLWIDRAAAAVSSYQTAFGATLLHRVGDGDDIVVQLAIDDAEFWISRADPTMNRLNPVDLGGTTGRILLVVGNPETVSAAAIKAGAVESSPVQDEHGWRLGRVIDHSDTNGKSGDPWPNGQQGTTRSAFDRPSADVAMRTGRRARCREWRRRIENRRPLLISEDNDDGDRAHSRVELVHRRSASIGAGLSDDRGGRIDARRHDSHEPSTGRDGIQRNISPIPTPGSGGGENAL